MGKQCKHNYEYPSKRAFEECNCSDQASNMIIRYRMYRMHTNLTVLVYPPFHSRQTDLKLYMEVKICISNFVPNHKERIKVNAMHLLSIYFELNTGNLHSQRPRCVSTSEI
jgi:hypothetical protein